jgi:hypothetical protein
MRIQLNDYMATLWINSTGLILVHRQADHVKYRALLNTSGTDNWRKQNLSPGVTAKKTG